MRTVLFLVTAIVTGIAAAAESGHRLKFITLDVAPWASLDHKTGKTIGVFPEVVNELEKRTGYSIVTTLTPFARVDRELESGQHDCTILIERDEAIVKRGALVSYHAIGVIARKGVDLRAYDDLYPLTVSVLRGATIESRFDADDKIKKEFDTDYEIGLRKIAHGRLDAIAGAMPTIRSLAQQLNLGSHLGKELLLANVPLVLQCSKNSPNLDAMPKLNRAIEEMKADGVLDQIKSRYYF